MKRTLLAFTIVATIISCKKSSVEEPSVINPVEKPEVENTDFYVYRVKSENNNPITPVANSRYYLLGYGYDITGRYADSSAARDRVIDMQKFVARYPGSAIVANMFIGGSPDVITAYNAEAFSTLLSKRIDETKNLKAFKTSITTLTGAEALSKKYIYGTAIYKAYWKKADMYLPTFDSLKSLLSDEFTSDIAVLTPSAIVKKYGTHILTDIQMGTKIEITYQAETTKTKAEERELKALLGISRGTIAGFGLSTGYYYSGPAYVNSNTNQKLFYKTFGGDASKLPQLPPDNSLNPRIDLMNWWRSGNLENSSLIDINEHGLFPLQDLIFDPIKKAAVKAYIDQYVQDNSVKLID